MNRSVMITFLQKAVHLVLLRPFLRLIFGVHIVGRENLESLNQYLIIANHNSHLDVLLLFYLLPIAKITTTHPVAEKVYFSRSRLVFALVNFLFRPIWIERGHPDTAGDPFSQIMNLIEQGHNIIIFPEGTRGKPGQMEHFKSGIGRLVARSPELPIVPVFLSGPERSLPKASFLLLPFWNQVIIGPPQKCHGHHRDITRFLEKTLVGLALSEAVRRHKRRAGKHKSPPAVAFLGIDGSGKSTLSRAVAEKLSKKAGVCLISDRLEFFEHGAPQPMQPLATEIFRKTISDYAKSAGSLKSYKIPKLAELLLRNHLYYEVRRWYNPDLIIMDGSPLLNMAAWAALYQQDFPDEEVLAKAIGVLTRRREIPPSDPIFTQFPELRHLRHWRMDQLVLPEVVLFLDVPPATACRRITARGEPRQAHETEEKLARLGAAYHTVCAVVRDNWSVPIAIIDGEQPPEEVVATALAFIGEATKAKDGNDGPAH